SAWATVMSDCGPVAAIAAGAEAACWRVGTGRTGGRRTNIETGIITQAATAAMICHEVRQSWIVISRAANGAMVSGAMPMPAETSETARLRWVSNQPVTEAIIGARIAAHAPPISTPNKS